ncbi:unnamed protein product, partial [marine sediment metagenome]
MKETILAVIFVIHAAVFAYFFFGRRRRIFNLIFTGGFIALAFYYAYHSWMSPWLTLPLAGIVAGLVGLVFGAPSLRIKGFYLAMSTIAAQFVLLWLIKRYTELAPHVGGTNPIPVDVPTLGGIDFSNYQWLYCLTVLLVILMTFFVKNLQRTNIGRTFIAIRDNDLAAEVMGVNLWRYKLIAFFIGCFYAGIAGWLWAHSMWSISPGQFELPPSIWALGMLI